MPVRLNEDAEVVRMIREGLKAKGGYCPCRLARTPENKCMCKEFRDQIADPDFEGYCHCLLYYKSKEESKSYRAAFIGNSLTLHGKCDYWWNELGMAATDKAFDYVTLVTEGLKVKKGKAESARVNLAVWETAGKGRSPEQPALDALLLPAPDLIVLQLSENISDTDGFREDYESLLRSLQSRCPNARIVACDDFWSEEKSAMKKAAAEACGVLFADFSSLRAHPETYQCGLGTTVQGDDGTPHTVEHAGVAAHPGNAGMKAIAEIILALIP